MFQIFSFLSTFFFMERTAIFYLTAKQKLKSWFSVNFADLYRLN